MTPEGKLVRALDRLARRYGGTTRKLSYEGRAGAPDRLVLLAGVHFAVELKRPGAMPTEHQRREHERLRAAGLHVYVCDSVESIESAIIAEIKGCDAY